jgi:hypothetical protein
MQWLRAASVTLGCDSDDGSDGTRALGREFALDGEALMFRLAFVGPSPPPKERGDWSAAAACARFSLAPIMARASVAVPSLSGASRAPARKADSAWIAETIDAAFDQIERGALDEAAEVYRAAAVEHFHVASMHSALTQCRVEGVRVVERIQIFNRVFRDLARGRSSSVAAPPRVPPGAFRGLATCAAEAAGTAGDAEAVPGARVVYSLRVPSVTTQSDLLGEPLLLVATLEQIAPVVPELERSGIDTQLVTRRVQLRARESARGAQSNAAARNFPRAALRPFRVVEPLRIASLDFLTPSSCCVSIRIENCHVRIPVTVHDVHFHLASTTLAGGARRGAPGGGATSAHASAAPGASVTPGRYVARVERDAFPFTLLPREAHSIIVCVEPRSNSAARASTAARFQSPVSISWSRTALETVARAAAAAAVAAAAAPVPPPPLPARQPPRRVLSECLVPWSAPGGSATAAGPGPSFAYTPRRLQPALPAPLASSAALLEGRAAAARERELAGEQPLHLALRCAASPATALSVFNTEVTVTNTGATSVSFLLYTVTFYANLAHSLTRSA